MRSLVASKSAQLSPSVRMSGVSGIQSANTSNSATFVFRAGVSDDTAVGRVYYDRDYYATGRLELSVTFTATSNDTWYDGVTSKLWQGGGGGGV